MLHPHPANRLRFTVDIPHQSLTVVGVALAVLATGAFGPTPIYRILS